MILKYNTFNMKYQILKQKNWMKNNNKNLFKKISKKMILKIQFKIEKTKRTIQMYQHICYPKLKTKIPQRKNM